MGNGRDESLAAAIPMEASVTRMSRLSLSPLGRGIGVACGRQPTSVSIVAIENWGDEELSRGKRGNEPLLHLPKIDCKLLTLLI
jgi:hypothetical protein